MWLKTFCKILIVYNYQALFVRWIALRLDKTHVFYIPANKPFTGQNIKSTGGKPSANNTSWAVSVDFDVGTK